MSIARFIHEKAIGISPSASLRDAAKAMRLSRRTSLPVMRGDRVTGLITERDLVKAMAISDRPGAALVAHYTSDCVMVARDDEGPVAVAKMLAVGCIDLPVVEHGRLIGIVSARELLAAEAQLQGVSL